MVFHDPLFLLLLLFLPPLAWTIIRRRSKGTVYFPTAALFRGATSNWRVWWSRQLPWLTWGALLLGIVALARPQIGLKDSLVRKEGVDIILALDVSTSMLAEDFQNAAGRVNRLAIVKEVTRDFIRRRPNDRIGIVIFSGRPYILSPLTWDHDWSETRLSEIKAGMIEDGTAIGAALTAAVSRLQESKARSKVVILLTDGNNNAGAVAPETAAAAAKALGVTVYPIGAGSKGLVPYPVRDQWGRKHYQNLQVDLDDALLRRIATTTGGRYFRATDTASLRQIFRRIDRMAKTAIEMPKFQDYLELYPYLAGLALVLLLAETVLANTLFRRLP
ncbi:Ca-activated chloride channel family protein [Hydrogenispora ethanolica]|uniref:Ca-activated chloride channel family protein n=1 Tax=Hydrogenispora ethanolica TaxID=1082276 RepID=A0A4R1RD62_HYDET|nr:VWA domain-containing protein [Hydrogenispora ethanolica]TCL63778.1 Ca-activated chloride channel family protein [Hydrogenispora ethanolica]